MAAFKVANMYRMRCIVSTAVTHINNAAATFKFCKPALAGYIPCCTFGKVYIYSTAGSNFMAEFGVKKSALYLFFQISVLIVVRTACPRTAAC